MTDTTVKNNETTQKESDEGTSKGDIKHIGYAGLIARVSSVSAPPWSD